MFLKSGATAAIHQPPKGIQRRNGQKLSAHDASLLQAPIAGNSTISPHNLLIRIGLVGEQGNLAQGHSRQEGMLPYLRSFVQLFTIVVAGGAHSGPSCFARWIIQGGTGKILRYGRPNSSLDLVASDSSVPGAVHPPELPTPNP